jgi:hypothetical protein
LFARIIAILAHENARPVPQGVAVVVGDADILSASLSAGIFFHGHNKGPFPLGKLPNAASGLLGREYATKQEI